MTDFKKLRKADLIFVCQKQEAELKIMTAQLTTYWRRMRAIVLLAEGRDMDELHDHMELTGHVTPAMRKFLLGGILGVDSDAGDEAKTEEPNEIRANACPDPGYRDDDEVV